MGELLAVVKRGNVIESEHRGNIAVVDANCNLLYYAGDAYKKTFARSALKPLQSIPLVQSGAAEQFLFTDKDISICCGSHNGEEQHVQTVTSMLFRLGLEENHLQCGAHPPYDEDSYKRLLHDRQSPGFIHNNCSGKHVGMLALALYLQSDIANYHKLNHPVQQKVLKTFIEMTGINEDDFSIAVDGCGIPTYGMALDKLAVIFSRFSAPEYIQSYSLKLAIQRIVSAMISYPEMVGGSDVLCTDLMKLLPGRVIAKGGAEGVYCIGLIDRGIGIAIKIDDGNYRAAYPAAIEVLNQLNVLSDQEKELLKQYHYPVIKNRRAESVGWITPVFTLKEA